MASIIWSSISRQANFYYSVVSYFIKGCHLHLAMHSFGQPVASAMLLSSMS
ncbi:unnamed protein product [Brassica oleracea]